MKCMASVDKKHIRRVTDEEASQLYEEGWNYVSKSLWKERVRDVENPTSKNPNPESKIQNPNPTPKIQFQNLKPQIQNLKSKLQ